MELNKSLTKILILALTFVFAFTTTVFAKSAENSGNTMTLEEAENYLTNYSRTVLNEEGAKIQISFESITEEQLSKAAEYIVEHGVETFENELNEGLGIADETFRKNNTPRKAASISVPIINKTIKNNGIIPVSGEYTNLVSFPKGNKLEYLAKLSCKVTAKNNKITDINHMSFDMLYMSAGGSHNSLKISKSVNNSAVGSVKAQYDVLKTINIPIGNFGIPVTETKTEAFCIVITFLK